MVSWRNSAGALLLALAGAVAVMGAEPTFFAERVGPVLEQHCVVCHGAEKSKAGLRLDTYTHLVAGSKNGEVVVAGNASGSELFRRITLPHDDDERMPGDDKPPLTDDEVRVIELWIMAGASPTQLLADLPDAPALPPRTTPAVALAPDWRPFARPIADLQQQLGVKLIPRSLNPTDGLVLRTASSPARCNDAVLARLEPVAALIVEAELARTAVTDAGLAALATFVNLRAIDLTQTKVTSRGLPHLVTLPHLETLNLTETPVDDSGLAHLRAIPTLQRVWLFGTNVTMPVN